MVQKYQTMHKNAHNCSYMAVGYPVVGIAEGVQDVGFL